MMIKQCCNVDMFNGSLAYVSQVTTQQRYILWHGLTFASADLLQFASIVILTLTAYQALKTSRATSQANILTVLPVLIIEFIESTIVGNYDTNIRIKNDGSGHAFNIRIDDAVVSFLDINDRWTLKLNLRPDHLAPGNERILGKKVLDKSNQTADVADFMTSMLRYKKDKPVKLNIYFSDVTNKRYITIVETGNGIARVRTPPAAYNTARKIRYQILNPLFNLYITPVNYLKRFYTMRFKPTMMTNFTKATKKTKKSKK
jgi:hypothetical protein